MGRFHSETGEFVGFRLLPHGLKSLVQAVVRKTTGRIPREPWIPFAARSALAAVLRRDAVVWEIGAGFSTLWLSSRVKKVTSVEASKEWYQKLSQIIADERLTNIDLRYEWVADRMADFSEVPDNSLDLLFVDGGPRGECLVNGFQKVRPGGHVYLDNWDVTKFWGDACDFPERHNSELKSAEVFVDYVPAQFGVNKGILLTKA